MVSSVLRSNSWSLFSSRFYRRDRAYQRRWHPHGFLERPEDVQRLVAQPRRHLLGQAEDGHDRRTLRSGIHGPSRSPLSNLHCICLPSADRRLKLHAQVPFTGAGDRMRRQRRILVKAIGAGSIKTYEPILDGQSRDFVQNLTKQGMDFRKTLLWFVSSLLFRILTSS